MSSTSTPLGYVGLGLMGGPMAQRLLAAGFPLHVWNRSRDKLAPLVDAGAQSATSPRAVAEASEIVFTCLTDTDAVEAVVFGADGIAEAGSAGKVLVDFSSMRPDMAKEFAARLRAQTGMGWIDAPVSGGVPGATNGTLTVMAGGEAADFERVREVVAHLAGRFTLMGANGTGQSTKLINQMIVGTGLALMAECCQFAEDAGIDPAKLPEALAGGRADSPVLQQFLPRMAARDRDVQGRVAIMVKDLNTVMDTARQLGTSLPLTGLAAEIHKLLVKHGLSDADNAATIDLYAPPKT
ncbi:NAD(P)-dependent oxidoreductase [Thalassobaculum sp. OXR-137]|uniref:NAD(P)-dependent oxidoreductase n=1 Tax=Thalassobaculum sp. OXR-137 TaxID=3100173 RepID=UPI002AC9B037|nr:NAD(P)-dependent oxidoreductase [Thalassobaculum sp. OXR-137]WPZ34319.1 NAD(P)-dependent oxidoreductase [Thalassobaculum sp. OXR-137]